MLADSFRANRLAESRSILVIGIGIVLDEIVSGVDPTFLDQSGKPIGFGNGVRFDGSLVSMRAFREKLIELRKMHLVNEAIAGAIVHEGDDSMSPPPSEAWGRSNGAFSDIRVNGKVSGTYLTPFT